MWYLGFRKLDTVFQIPARSVSSCGERAYYVQEKLQKKQKNSALYANVGK